MSGTRALAGSASLWVLSVWFELFTSISLPIFPLTVLDFSLYSAAPYVSALSEANTTHSVVAEGFQLATERRAKERQEFEQTLKEKETLKVEMEERHAKEEEEREKEEITTLRQAQVCQTS